MEKRKFHWRIKKIPKRFVPFLFPLMLSGFMTLLITGISIVRVLGIDDLIVAPGNFLEIWFKAYVPAWLIAYPVLLMIMPIVKRVVNWLTSDHN
jgi:hypothetical protein